MSKKKTTAQKPTKKEADESAAKKKTAPEKKQEPPAKLNDPVGEFTEEELREVHTDCANRTRDIRKKAAVMAEAKRSAKIATENYNAATDDLTCYISGFKEIPLLDQQNDKTDEDPDWRAIPIEDLDIEEHISKAFSKAGVTTAGAVDDAMEEKGLTIVANLGTSQYKAINDALDKVCSQPVPEKKEEAAQA